MTRASKAIARLRTYWRRRANSRRSMAELAACPPGELHRIATDVGLTSTDLKRLVCSHAGPSKLLPQRLERLGLDPEFVRRGQLATYRDLARACVSCTDWRRCERDLARGNVQAGMGDYCLNTHTIDALTVEGRAGAQAAPG
jgi:hypothetical protein